MNWRDKRELEQYLLGIKVGGNQLLSRKQAEEIVNDLFIKGLMVVEQREYNSLYEQVEAYRQ